MPVRHGKLGATLYEARLLAATRRDVPQPDPENFPPTIVKDEETGVLIAVDENPEEDETCDQKL